MSSLVQSRTDVTGNSSSRSPVVSVSGRHGRHAPSLALLPSSHTLSATSLSVVARPDTSAATAAVVSTAAARRAAMMTSPFADMNQSRPSAAAVPVTAASATLLGASAMSSSNSQSPADNSDVDRCDVIDSEHLQTGSRNPPPTTETTKVEWRRSAMQTTAVDDGDGMLFVPADVASADDVWKKEVVNEWLTESELRSVKQPCATEQMADMTEHCKDERLDAGNGDLGPVRENATSRHASADCDVAGATDSRIGAVVGEQCLGIGAGDSELNGCDDADDLVGSTGSSLVLQHSFAWCDNQLAREYRIHCLCRSVHNTSYSGKSSVELHCPF